MRGAATDMLIGSRIACVASFAREPHKLFYPVPGFGVDGTLDVLHEGTGLTTRVSQMMVFADTGPQGALRRPQTFLLFRR